MKLKKLIKTRVSLIKNLWTRTSFYEINDVWFAWGYFLTEEGKTERLSLPNKDGEYEFDTKEKAKEAIKYFKKEIWVKYK